MGTPQERIGNHGRLPTSLAGLGSLNRTLVDTLPDPVCIVNTDWQIVFVNNALLSLFGESEDYFLGKTVLQFISPTDRKAISEKMMGCFQTGNKVVSEQSVIRADGTTIPIESTTTLLLTEDGEPEAIVCVARDISSRRKSEEIVHSTSQRAMLYVDVLGHDISNQLQIMMSSTELLFELTQTSQEQKLLGTIAESISKCERLIFNTSTMERLIVAPMTPKLLDMALNEVLISVISIFDDLQVHASFEIAHVPILADEFLNDLLFGLFDNAYRHNPAENKHVWMRLCEYDGGYEVTISDNGPGICQEIRGDMLNIEGRRGGVGLHLCQKTVEKYGGSIDIRERVENNPECGITVRLWFPKLHL